MNHGLLDCGESSPLWSRGSSSSGLGGPRLPARARPALRKRRRVAALQSVPSGRAPAWVPGATSRGSTPAMRSIVPCLRSPRPSRVGVHLFGLFCSGPSPSRRSPPPARMRSTTSSLPRCGKGICRGSRWRSSGRGSRCGRRRPAWRTSNSRRPPFRDRLPDPVDHQDLHRRGDPDPGRRGQARAGRSGGETPGGDAEIVENITLGHLLTHTSGIKDFINSPTASLRLKVTEEEVLRATADGPFRSGRTLRLQQHELSPARDDHPEAHRPGVRRNWNGFSRRSA